ncbi:MAG: nucleotidyltransferase domain-containing protein [Candidatus Heimdallarchaeota archaeon]|nr:nucleotidyltransferase domain-containing protein [Candidatus Heimdallarchaeota archaeon]MDH5645576.1 nucleotidyltransferase domain-containing protein [Candidatus Heimdallarchaeota archaeon]
MSKHTVENKEIDLVITYSEDHWKLLANKRCKAQQILDILSSISGDFGVYGSIARGDIHPSSDIDIIGFELIQPYKMEYLLENIEQTITDLRIVMATPNHSIKGVIQFDDEVSITFPLVKLNPREKEFYQFAGRLTKWTSFKDRIVGINKNLKLIEPLSNGHRERTIKLVPTPELLKFGFTQRIIEERKRVLYRRDKIGRTGIFLNHPVNMDDGFSLTLKALVDRNPIVRRKVRGDK